MVFLVAFAAFQWLISPFILGFFGIGNFAKLYQIAFFITIFAGSFLGSFLFANQNFLEIWGESVTFVVLSFLGIGYFLLNGVDLLLTFFPKLKLGLISTQNLASKSEIVIQVFIFIFCFIFYFLQPNQPYLTVFGLFLASFWQFIQSFFCTKLSQNEKVRNLWQIHSSLSLLNIFVFFVALIGSSSFFGFGF